MKSILEMKGNPWENLFLTLITIGVTGISFADSPPGKSVLEYRALGYRAQHTGHFEQALIYYLKALQIQPDLAVVHNDLGIVYEEFGEWQSAEKFYLSALKIDPNCIQAYTNLALLYETTKDKKRAAYYWSRRQEAGQVNNPWTKRAKEEVKQYEEVLQLDSQKKSKGTPKSQWRFQGNLSEQLNRITVPALDFVDVEFNTVMAKLSQLSGVPIESDESAIKRTEMKQSLRVTLMTAEYLPLTDVLAILLAGTNLNYRVEENQIFISDQII